MITHPIFLGVGHTTLELSDLPILMKMFLRTTNKYDKYSDAKHK